MKVTDLMIGDYVSFNGTICKVTELSCKKWVRVETEQGELRVNNDYILDSLKPIPLTAEILEYINLNVALQKKLIVEIKRDVMDLACRIAREKGYCKTGRDRIDFRNEMKKRLKL